MIDRTLLRIGIIGTGQLGSIHAHLAAATPGVNLVGLFDLDHDRAAGVAEELGSQRFERLEDLLAEVDACCIVTPTTTHAEIAIQALESGVHSFIEKPVVSSAEEGNRLREIADRSGCIVQVGHVERFNSAFLALDPMYRDPLFIEAHRLSRFSSRATDVAVIHDLMIHDIDLVLTMKGGQEPSDIRASGVAVISDEIDIANARLEFADGCTANLTASRISRNPMRKMRLFARDSYISLDFADPTLEIFTSGEIEEGKGEDVGVMLGAIEQGTQRRSIRYVKPEVQSVNAIAEELRLFVESIRSKNPPPVTLDEGIRAVMVAERILHEITLKIS